MKISRRLKFTKLKRPENCKKNNKELNEERNRNNKKKREERKRTEFPRLMKLSKCLLL